MGVCIHAPTYKVKSTKNHDEVKQTEQEIDFHPPVKKQKNADQEKSSASLLYCSQQRGYQALVDHNTEAERVSNLKRGNIN